MLGFGAGLGRSFGAGDDFFEITEYTAEDLQQSLADFGVEEMLAEGFSLEDLSAGITLYLVTFMDGSGNFSELSSEVFPTYDEAYARCVEYMESLTDGNLEGLVDWRDHELVDDLDA